MIASIISRLLNDYHILTTFTSINPTVLRFEPPLAVTRDEVDRFVSSLDDLLHKERNTFDLFVGSMANTIKGALHS